jgi:tRNA 2-selenouridine synthase
VRLLLEDYGFFAADAEAFCKLLDGLVELRGRTQVGHWQAQARAGLWPAVFEEMMRLHYDPLYQRSMQRSYPHLAEAEAVDLADEGGAALAAAVRQLLA